MGLAARGVGETISDVAAKSKNQTKPEPSRSAPAFFFTSSPRTPFWSRIFPISLSVRFYAAAPGCCWWRRPEATLFTDSRYTFQAREEVLARAVEITRQGLMRAVGEGLRRQATARARGIFRRPGDRGAEGRAWQAARGEACAVDAGQGRGRRRCAAVKDAGELRDMREAAELISEVSRDVVRSDQAGGHRTGAGGRDRVRHEAGAAAGPSFETIVASGPRSAWAHARPTSKLLEKNELVVLDQGAILRGYCSDMTRTVFCGTSASEGARACTMRCWRPGGGQEAIRPGVTAGEVDAAARGVLDSGMAWTSILRTARATGWDSKCTKCRGLGRGEKSVLQEGMVVTVEPGVYIEGVGGIRIEDDVVVTAQRR